MKYRGLRYGVVISRRAALTIASEELGYRVNSIAQGHGISFAHIEGASVEHNDLGEYVLILPHPKQNG